MDTEAYQNFFSGFDRLAHPETRSGAWRWKCFFDDFLKNWRCEPESELRVKQIDFGSAEEFFASFSDKYDYFLKTGMGVNVFDVLLPRFDELSHSRVLAWLLDSSESHGQKSAFLRLLLDAIPEEYKNGRALFPKSVPEKSRYRVKVEESYDEGQRGKKQRSRIDIEIDGTDFLIIIEVKIYSGEMDDQLSRYEKIFRSRRGFRPGGVLFLTPDGRSPRSEDNKAVAPVSWRVLDRSFRSFLIHADAKFSASHAHVLIRQFCDRIRTF